MRTPAVHSIYPVDPAAALPRILIADDQRDIVDSLRLLLKNEGFLIDAAASPAEALLAVRSQSYDVLLMDLNYSRDTTSGGEGLELLSRVRQTDDTLPVILMTAWGSVELAVEAMKIGGCDFVQKPWDNGKLLEALRRLVPEGAARREKKSRASRSERILRELDEAREVQQRLLPPETSAISGCEIQTTSRPANNVGGDYMDAMRLTDTQVGLCIADVSGKGLPAALLASGIQAAVRAYAPGRSPAQVCAELNRIAAESMPRGRFVTLFYAVLDTSRRFLTYCNAGHIPPVLVRRGGIFERLAEGGTVLGLFPGSAYSEAGVTLASGDRLVLVTDGITEAADAEDNEFGDERLVELLIENRSESGMRIKQRLLEALEEFSSGELDDDATVMVVSLEPALRTRGGNADREATRVADQDRTGADQEKTAHAARRH